MWIFLSFYQCFKIWIFAKNKTKNIKKTIEKDSGITIDNVILKFFNEKKSDFIKKVNFSIDNDFQYFPPKNHFLYRKNDIQENLVVKKNFSQQCQAVGRFTPPPTLLLRTSQTLPKFYLWVLRRKLEKHDYQSQNVKMENFPKKTYLSGFRQTFSKIRQSFKG